jgi:DNA-directed RNA polymerase subunit E'/Rpb7
MRITETIELLPKYFGNRSIIHIEEQLKEKLLNKCFKKYGYITDVDDIKIISNKLASANSMAIFVVSCDITTIKPIVGDTIEATVNMTFQSGILAEIYKKLKVFIPTDRIKDNWEYDGSPTSNGCPFINKTTGESINFGSTITVTIKTTKFEEDSFSCIGVI